MQQLPVGPCGPAGPVRVRMRRPWRIFLLVLLSMPGAGILQGVRGDSPPDFVWRGPFEPLRGAFNRDEPSDLRFTLRLAGDVDEIPIGWRIFRRNDVVASGDTLIPTAKRGRDAVFSLRIPGLQPGLYMIEMTTDPDNRIEERDESNNALSFPFRIPNGAPVRFRCEGPEGAVWDLHRVELSTSTGDPYPDDFGTIEDTTRGTDYEVVVNGIEPGDYMGVFFGPTVNRVPILISVGTFTMPDPPEEIEVVWPRTTPYLVGRPRISGDAPVAVGGESGAPRWQPFDRYSLDGTARNPTDVTTDIAWTLRFLDESGYTSAEKDTMLYVGALGTSGIYVSGRMLDIPGNYLLQAEIRVPWPSGFEDLGEEPRAASSVHPLGWIEIER